MHKHAVIQRKTFADIQTHNTDMRRDTDTQRNTYTIHSMTHAQKYTLTNKKTFRDT